MHVTQTGTETYGDPISTTGNKELPNDLPSPSVPHHLRPTELFLPPEHVDVVEARNTVETDCHLVDGVNSTELDGG